MNHYRRKIHRLTTPGVQVPANDVLLLVPQAMMGASCQLKVHVAQRSSPTGHGTTHYVNCAALYCVLQSGWIALAY